MGNNSYEKNYEKILRGCLGILFIIYILFLFRITFFKQAALNHLFSAIGVSERTISIIPFKSIYNMAVSGTSIGRIMENILGNIVLFIPFGMLFPIIFDKRQKGFLCSAVAFSLVIEIIQFILALGSTDIDDLIFNVVGAYIGYFVSGKIKRKFKSYVHYLLAVILLTIVLGSGVLGYLFVHQTDLFIISGYDIAVENREFVETFIDTPATDTGKYVELVDHILRVEKSVASANDLREIKEFEITENSKIFICYDKIEYLFSAVTGEYQRYEKIDYDDFISQVNRFERNNNVRIWSDDGERIEYMVIIEWVE